MHFAHNLKWDHPAEYPFTPGTRNLSRKGAFASTTRDTLHKVWDELDYCLDIFHCHENGFLGTSISTPYNAYIWASTPILYDGKVASLPECYDVKKWSFYLIVVRDM
jgi:hypothetical protein